MSVSGCSSCSNQTYAHTLPDGATSTIVTKPNGSVVSQSTTNQPASADSTGSGPGFGPGVESGGLSAPGQQGGGSLQSAGLLNVTA